MKSIRWRLEALEGSAAKCRTCGWPPLPGEEVEYRYVVEWRTLGEDLPEPEPPCPNCGRERVIVVDWPDSPGSPEEWARLKAQHEEALAARPWLRGEDAEPPSAEPVPDTRRGPERGEGTSYEPV
jgi:hypothetical protein